MHDGLHWLALQGQAGIGIAAHVSNSGSNGRIEATEIKAGAPVTASTDANAVR